MHVETVVPFFPTPDSTPLPLYSHVAIVFYDVLVFLSFSFLPFSSVPCLTTRSESVPFVISASHRGIGRKLLARLLACLMDEIKLIL